MTISPLTLRIAMLNADAPVPHVIEQRAPSYGHVFHELLSQSATRVAPGLAVEAEYFDVYRGVYPESLTHFDAIVISGSGASSYEDKDWIKQLDAYVAKVYVEQPRVKIFGSCFGHQIICQSLLREHGVYVEKDPKGMEMGVHTVQLEQDFLKALGSRSSVTNNSTLRLQFIHGDHVKIPEGAYEPNHVLTYQGHFEFDSFINTETCKAFAGTCGWGPQFIEASIEAMDKDDDSKTAADMVMRFFLEGRHAVPGIGGLMSPPLED
ncbi:putative glutamine amidotransferase-like protein C13C5.04 [Fusarium culmorum]|uniref:Putative glutamine amidotransferase-like protein C13C5.04 n=1 Tax=Fusarium culmorum TaxID=5516 RepID=A0A2T4GPL1_FUSCU|nr:putative glutamine amidotransferase-like protein C13C5.04 [Fusarium culmorum]